MTATTCAGGEHCRTSEVSSATQADVACASTMCGVTGSITPGPQQLLRDLSWGLLGPGLGPLLRPLSSGNGPLILKKRISNCMFDCLKSEKG